MSQLIPQLHADLKDRIEHHDAVSWDDVARIPKTPEDGDDAYPDDRPLTWLFGTHPTVKQVGVALRAGHEGKQKKHFEDEAGISRRDLDLDLLEDAGIVSFERSVGPSKLYARQESRPTHLLDRIELELLALELDPPIEDDEQVVSAAEPDETEPTATEAYAEETPLVLLFGDYPEPKILSAVLSELGSEINLTDIARLAGVSRGAVYNHLDQFLRYGVLVESRTVGPSTMYRLNEDSELVSLLWDLEEALISQFLD
jgi:DNA-binding transcriptional ArsR family regulator